MRIIVGVTGSSGVIFAQEFLKQCDAEKFLIMSKWGKVVVKEELGISEKEFASFAKRQFSDDDLTAPHCVRLQQIRCDGDSSMFDLNGRENSIGDRGYAHYAYGSGRFKRTISIDSLHYGKLRSQPLRSNNAQKFPLTAV